MKLDWFIPAEFLIRWNFPFSSDKWTELGLWLESPYLLVTHQRFSDSKMYLSSAKIKFVLCILKFIFH